MSGLIAEGWLGFIPLAVVLSSVAGSLHCVSMCGGLVTSFARTREELTLYQLGRLAGYVTFGAAGGWLGRNLLASDVAAPISWLAALLLGAGLIRLGIACWRGEGLHLFRLPGKWFSNLLHARSGAFTGGVLTALLPCGWLHGFLLAAVATRGTASGALLMGLFWLGTLPALVAAPTLVRKVLGPLSRRAPRFSAILLIAAGLLTVGAKVLPLGAHDPGQRPGETPSHCH